MKIRHDGSIQSGMTPTPSNVGRQDDFAIYRCMVTRVIYVDDSSNITANSSNARVLYDVVVLGGFSSGQIISNCRLASIFGGDTSYFERILRAASNDVSKTKLSSADGDIVYVQFVQGHTGYPVIIALDNGINTKGKIGATSSQGPRSLKEYNGVRETINKDGEFQLDIKGGSSNSEKGSFTPNSDSQITVKADKDGKYTITTKSGATIEIDGPGNKITLLKGSTIIELDGNGDKISLKGGFIDLGASVSDFAVLFTELLTTFNSHTHNAPQAPAGVLPTTPPLAPMLQTVGSLTVKVQP